jgi:hypothetical protein
MSHEIDGVVYIVNNVIGPFGDEWDSPGWNDFWEPVYRRIDREVEEAKAAGKPFKVINEEEARKLGI